MADLGLTHVALAVKDLAASIEFYRAYAGMQVIHERTAESGARVAWVSDLTRPFVLVLIQAEGLNDTPLGPFGHLGVALESREAVDRLTAQARAEGRLRMGPTDSGPPVGYWAYIADPDGNTLEVSFGQVIAFTVEQARAVES